MTTSGSQGRGILATSLERASAHAEIARVGAVTVGGEALPGTQSAKKIAPVTLWRPSVDRFFDYHSLHLEKTDPLPPRIAAFESFLERFRMDARRSDWIAHLDKEHGLSHVIGDIFTKNTYEGWHSRDTIIMLKHMVDCYMESLTPLKSTQISRNLLRMRDLLEGAASLTVTKGITRAPDLAKTIAARVRALTTGESVLIPGGYTGARSSGHAVLYMVTKQRDGVYAFYEYNTGDGAGDSGFMVKDIVKQRFKRLAYQDIPETVLLTGLHGASFFQALTEPLVEQPDQEYDMARIHRLVFPTLTPYAVTEKTGYFSAQVAGTCSFQSLMAWAHFELPEEEYKLFATWQKAHVLLLTYSEWIRQAYMGDDDDEAIRLTPEAYEDFLQLPSHQQRLLELSANEVLFHVKGRLLKHVSSGAVVPEIFKDALAIARVVKKFVQGLHDERALRSLRPNALSPIEISDRRSAEEILGLLASKRRARFTPYAYYPLSIQVLLPAAELARVTDQLQEVLTIGRSSHVRIEQKYLGVCQWIIHSLPSLADCQSVTPTIQLAENLGQLHRFVMGTSLSLCLGHNLPWSIAASNKLLAWMHFITGKLIAPFFTDEDVNNWEHQRFINIPHSSFEDSYGIILDPTLKHTLEDAATYFAPFHSSYTFEDTSSPFEFVEKSDHPQVRFWYALLKKMGIQQRENLGPSFREIISTQVLKLMTAVANNGEVSPTHPVSSVLLFKQAYHEALVLLNKTPKIHRFDSLIHGASIFSFVAAPQYQGSVYTQYSVRGYADNWARNHIATLSKLRFGPIGVGYQNVIQDASGEFSRLGAKAEETPILRINYWERRPEDGIKVDGEFLCTMQRGQAEPLQNASLLLYYFSDRLDRLADPQLQKLAFLSIFKTELVRQTGDPQLSFESPIAQNLRSPAFITHLKEFFNRAFTHYIDRQAGGIPEHDVCIFLSMLAACCRYIASKDHAKEDILADLSPDAERYLAEKITDESPLPIRFKADLIQVLTSVLIHKDKETRDKAVVRALTSWMRYNGVISRVKETDRIQWLEHVVRFEFLQALPSLMCATKTQLHAVAKTLFDHKLEGIKAGYWKNFGQGTAAFKATIPDSDDSYLIMDFGSATLANESGVLSTGQKPIFFNDTFFKLFFGETTPVFEIAGQHCLITYKDHVFKTYVRLDQPYLTDWTAEFQIKDPDTGAWLYFAPSSNLKALPDTLARRYWFFYDSLRGQVIGFSRADFSKKVIIAANGISVYPTSELDKDPSFHVSRALATDPGGAPLKELVAQLERAQNVELETYASGAKHLVLPRFQGWGGDKLRFIQGGDQKWYYAFSRSYWLDTQEQPAFMSWTKNYVSLVNARNERMILVPVCKWVISTQLGSGMSAVLDIEESTPKSALIDGTFHYLEYNVDKASKLNGGSLEAKLYLAHLWLLQKEFVDAYTLLKSIPTNELEGSAGQELVESIIHHSIKNPDFGPESIACLILFCFKNSRLVQKVIDKEIGEIGLRPTPSEKWLADIYEHYIHSFERVPESMKLPGADELSLIRSLSPGTDIGAFRKDLLLSSADRSAWTTSERSESTRVSRHRNEYRNYTYPIYSYYYSGSADAQLTLTVPYKRNDGYELSTTDARMLLLAELRGIGMADATFKARIEHLKLYVQIQSQSENTSSAFLLLMAAMIDYAENGPRDTFTHKYYADLILHLYVAAGKTSIETYVPQAPAKIHGTFEDDTYRRRYEFVGKFSSLAQSLCNSTLTYLPSKVGRFVLSGMSTLGDEEPIHGKHSINWLTTPDLRGVLSARTVLDPVFSEEEMTGMFILEPFKPLVLDEDRAKAVARQESEQEAVDKENGLFLEDLEAGKRKIQSRFKVKAIAEKYADFVTQSTVAIKDLKKRAEFLERSICTKLNKMPTSSILEELAELAGRLHGQTPVYGMEEAVGLFLLGKKTVFLDANPLLADSEINELMGEIFDWLMLQTDAQHLARIQGFGSDYEIHKGDISGEYYGEMLYTSCESKREYDPRKSPELLVFEYFSKMRLRPQQADLINQMLRGDATYEDATAQLIMGGGKTSVLATILLALATSKGLACFVTPASQFATVKENLALSIGRCLKREIVPLTVERADLSGAKVGEVYERLEEAQRLGKPIIAKPETLQTIELEFVTGAIQISQSSGAPQAEAISVLHNLARIRSLTESRGHLLCDEVDLVLDTLKEVNFPGGTQNTMAPDRVEMISQLFEIMADSTILVELDGTRKSLKALTKVSQVLEEEYDVETFKNHLIPVIARTLAQRHEALKIPATHIESFVRFASGKFKKPLSTEDSDFLEYINKLHKSDSTAEKDAANQIALAKHILLDVLVTTLSRSCGRNFGRTRGEPAGKCVPYQGVDTPSTSEFGYHYEAACYQFQTAMQTGVKADQIEQLANFMTASATKTATRMGIPFNLTPEAKQFLVMTGIELHEAKLPERLELAVAKLEGERKVGNFKNILLIEAETVLTCVTYHAHRVSSGPQSFLSMMASRRAFSGTPSNVDTYPISMKKEGAYLPDLGTEGQILATMLDRGARTQLVHSVSKADPVEMIRKVMDQYPDEPERVSMLLDPSGLFKAYNNKEVAFSVRDFLRDDIEHSLGTKFKGVLFFTRPPKAQEMSLFAPEATVGREDQGEEDAQATPDTLAFLPMGSDTIVFLKGTSIEELASQGLNPGDYFVIDDERHTTGTDVRMKPNAVAVMTMDETLAKPRMCQAMMRLRQYLFTQDVHTVMLKSTLSRLGIEKPTTHDVIALVNRAQALAKYRIMARSFNQKIDNFFRHQALRRILTAALEKNGRKIASETKALLPFLIYDLQDEPFELFAGVDEEVSTIKHLQERFEHKVRLFSKALVSLGVELGEIGKVASKAGEFRTALMQEAEECRFLPKTQKVLAADVNGVEQEVEQVAEVEVVEEVDQSIENEQEILRDLAEIRGVRPYGTRNQIEWSAESAGQFLVSVRQNEHKRTEGERSFRVPNWQSLVPSFLRENHHFAYFTKGFEHALFANFICTENYQYTSSNSLPMFHPKLRPADTMLIVKRSDGSFAGVLMSLHEAVFWTNYIRENKAAIKDVWLVCPDGTSVADTEEPVPHKEEAIRMLLVQLNAYRGNVDYLNMNIADTRKWLSSADPSSAVGGTHIMSKITLVKYAVLAANDPMQRKQFVESEIFNPEQAARLKRQRQRLIAHLRDKRDNTVSAAQVRGYDEAKVAAIDDEELISYLLPQQVNWIINLALVAALRLPEQIQALDADRIPYINSAMVPHLKPEQIPLIGTKIELLSQITSTQVNDVSLEQVLVLDNDMYKELRKVELIQALGGPQLLHISAAQVPHLTHHQIALLPAKLELVQALSVTALHQATQNQLDLISNDQFALLNVEATAVPATIAKLNGTYADSLEIGLVKHLTRKEAIQALKKDRVNALAPAQLAFVSDAQLGLLSDQALIRSISTSAQLSCLKLSEVGQHLTIEQLRALSVDDVKHLPIDEAVLSKLDESHFTHMSKEQIQCLNTKETIIRLSKEQLAHILRRQLTLLSEDQISLVEGDAINAIAPERVGFLQASQVPHLTEGGLVRALPPPLVNHVQVKVVDLLTTEQLGHLSAAALVQRLDMGRIPHLGDHGFRELSSVQIAQIVDPALVDRLGPDQAKYLGNEALAAMTRVDLLEHLTDDQLTHVSADMFGRIPQARIKGITEGSLIEKLSAGQFAHVEDAQLIYATDAILLVHPARVPNIPFERVATISDKALVPYLSEAQLSHLAGDLVKSLDDVGQIQRLGANQIPLLKDSQVPHLKKEQLAHVTADLAVHLVQSQLGEVPEKIVPFLVSNQAKWVPSDRVKHLSTRAINGITVAQINSITAEQLGVITLEALVQAVPIASVDGLCEEAVQYLTDLQLGALTKAELVKRVSASEEKISLLRDEALKHLVQAQVLAIKDQSLLDRLPQECLLHLNAEQLKKLSKEEQICALSADQVNHIQTNCIGFLTDVQIQFLTEAALIQALPLEKADFVKAREHFSVAQLEKLLSMGKVDLIPKDRFDELSADSIQQLGSEYVCNLKTKEALQHLSDDQLSHITKAQVAVIGDDAKLAKRLPDHKLCDIETRHVPNLSEKQMALLSVQCLIQAIPLDAVAKVVKTMTKGQTSSFTPEQIAQIKDADGVQKVIAGNEGYLPPEAWPYLSVEQQQRFIVHDHVIESLPKDQIERIPTSFFQYLKDPAVLQSKAKISSFLAHLSPSQRENIPDTIIDQAFAGIGSDVAFDLAANLSPLQISYLSESRFKTSSTLLDVLRIAAPNGLAYVCDPVLNRLTVSQVQAIKDKGALNLFCKRVAAKDESMLTYLSAEQISLLENPEFVNGLDDKKLENLNASVVKKMPLGSLWTQPAVLLKKASFMQKAILFVGLAIQSFVLTFAAFFMTLFLAPLCIFKMVRGLLARTWGLTAYSWRFIKILGK